METIKFKDLFRFQKKSNLRAVENNETGKYVFYTSSSIISKKTDKPIYFEKSLIIGNGGSANIHYAEQPFSATSHCYVATSQKEDLNVKYVYYYLYSNLYLLQRGFKGAGLKNISSKYIDEIDIPIPNTETQNKIVAILDKVRNLIDKRKKSITQYDDLLRATFLNMFGDPIVNPKGWQRSTLQKLCDNIIDCPHETPKYTTDDSEFYCIRSNDIQNGAIDLSVAKKVSEVTYSKRIKRYEPKVGEVVYTREGGRLGNAALIPAKRKICLGQRMMLFIANEKVSTNKFIWAFLNSNSIKTKVRNISGGGAAPRVNVGQLKILEVFVPPLELQLRFAQIVKRIENIRNIHQRSLQHLDALFNSLSQLGFKGQLVFNSALDLEVLLENDYNFFKENGTLETTILLLTRMDKDYAGQKEFYGQGSYEKGKTFVFELLKEGKIRQIYDEETKSIKLSI